MIVSEILFHNFMNAFNVHTASSSVPIGKKILPVKFISMLLCGDLLC